jgi:hypothetical protein
MTLQSHAQALYVIDPMSPASQLPAHDQHAVSAIPPHHKHEGEEQLMSFAPIEVTEPVDVEIVVEELPGAPAGTKDPEIEVHDEALHVEDEETSKDDKKDGKNEKWDWSKHGPHGFVAWIKERISSVPKHSGYDSAGLERAMAYMDRLDNEISKAMRLDLDGDLDADKIEKVRSELDEGLSRLHARLDKVKGAKKSSRKKKKTAADLSSEILTVMDRWSDDDINSYVAETTVPGETWTVEKAVIQLANGDEPGFEGLSLIKQAQKIMGVSGVMITVPLLISRIARVCVNGVVSGGHDIEYIYNNQVKKYKLDDREQAEVRQLIFDMGYTIREDRGYFPEDNVDISSSDNFDWQANYPDGRGYTVQGR